MPWVRRGDKKYFYEYEYDKNSSQRKKVYVGAEHSLEASVASKRENMRKQRRREQKEVNKLFETLINELDQIRSINNIIFRYALIENDLRKRKSEIRRLRNER